MQGDIFATKGIEYLIVIAYLLALVGMLRLLTPRRVAQALGGSPRAQPSRSRPWFLLAEGYSFHQGHTWADWNDPSDDKSVRPDGSQIAYCCDQGGRFDTYILPASGGKPRLVLDVA